MKRFRSLTMILAALAAALLVAAGIGSAIAYFTTYAEADGGMPVNFSHREEITEVVDDLHKDITITNQKGQPVYVRARAFAGEKYNLIIAGFGWSEGEDGWWYYEKPLAAGESTEALSAELTGLTEDDLKDGKELNIAVVYESALVIYEYNESTKDYEPVTDWSVIFDSGSSNVTKGGE